MSDSKDVPGIGDDRVSGKPLNRRVPREITLVLTNRCNWNCPFCCEPRGTADHPVDLLKRRMRNLWDVGVAWLDFSGGEPLLYRPIVGAIQTAKATGFRVSLSTNGQLLGRHLPDIEPFVDQWNLSIHGTPDLHDRIVGVRGAFSRAVGHIRRLSASNHVVHVTYVVLAMNVGAVRDTAEMLVAAGTSKICFNYPFRRGHGARHSSDATTAQRVVAAQLAPFLSSIPTAPLTVYHNMNLTGECVLLRPDGELWAVPHTNETDYEVLGHADAAGTALLNYRYLHHHLMFTTPRLGPVCNPTVEFSMGMANVAQADQTCIPPTSTLNTPRNLNQK